jgi:hypothetical protein
MRGTVPRSSIVDYAAKEVIASASAPTKDCTAADTDSKI